MNPSGYTLDFVIPAGATGPTGATGPAPALTIGTVTTGAPGASVTDFFDGYLARKNNQVTDTGKMLDAIADKVLVNPILVILAANGFINAIIPVIIISRDIVVDAIKMEAGNKGKVVAAIKSGKLKTAAMMLGLVLVFFYNMPFEFINIRVDLFLLYFACIMSIISAVQYFKLNKEIIFVKKEIL